MSLMSSAMVRGSVQRAMLAKSWRRAADGPQLQAAVPEQFVNRQIAALPDDERAAVLMAKVVEIAGQFAVDLIGLRAMVKRGDGRGRGDGKVDLPEGTAADPVAGVVLVETVADAP